MNAVADQSGRRRGRRWKDMSRAHKYAFIQTQVLFWALYIVAIYLVATNVGVTTAAFVFGGGILGTVGAAFIGVRRRRGRNSSD
jgi:hypothetical protein